MTTLYMCLYMLYDVVYEKKIINKKLLLFYTSRRHSYQKCVLGKDDIADHNDDGGNKYTAENTSFAPSYKVYDCLGGRTQYRMETAV